ncbi:MAG: phosphoglucosamine mutase [Elusimicrobiaceae bacterium]|nr:phosphoglucosamine mutase [Elusimicrobiaceae bacterium]
MPKYFGTDGVRSIWGKFPLTEDFVTKLGYCALKELSKQEPNNTNKNIFIAQDSRASGKAILECLTKGIRAAGYNVLSLGISTTPSVSILTQKYKNICGIVISASHNPAEFNGIKFFSAQGTKLREDIEDNIEREIENLTAVPAPQPNTKFCEVPEKTEEYIDFLKSTLTQVKDLKGLNIVLDCANGASSQIAPRVFEELGAKVTVINNKPNGLNINKNAGALYTEGLQEEVKKCKADIGLSFDGDADRLIAVTEEGTVFDGDNIISTVALYLKENGKLKGNKAVLTIMANLGLINFLKSKGIEPVLTKVGDKYVFEELIKNNLSIGGETSGHIIFKDIAPAGDGILTALQLLGIVKKSGKKLSHFKNMWQKYPLKLVPVKVEKKIPLEEVEGFCPYLKELENSMGSKGRIVVRYSGTEPLLRVLVEDEDKEKVEDICQKVVTFYKSKVKTC